MLCCWPAVSRNFHHDWRLTWPYNCCSFSCWQRFLSNRSLILEITSEAFAPEESNYDITKTDANVSEKVIIVSISGGSCCGIYFEAGLVNVTQVEEKVCDIIVRDHDFLLKCFIFGEDAVFHWVFVNQNSTETPPAWEGGSEWELQDVWDVSDEVFLVIDTAKLESGSCCFVCNSFIETLASIVSLCEVTLAASWVAIVGEHAYNTWENTVDTICNLCCHFGLHHWLPFFFKLIDLGNESVFHNSLGCKKTGTESFTGAVDISRQAGDACMNNGFLWLWDDTIKPFVLIHPFLYEWADVFKRSLFNWREGPDQIDEISIFLPNAGIILTIAFILNSLELSLEIQCVSHLVEQESEEEVSPVAVKGKEAVILYGVKGVSKLVAIG